MNTESKPYDPLVSRPHIRAPWRDEPGCFTVFTHCFLSQLKGEEGSPHRAAYNSAKLRNDMGAAFDVVDRIWNEGVLDLLVDRVVEGGRAPIYVFPHPGFDDDLGVDVDAPHRDGPRNALPFAFAERLRQEIGGEVNNTLMQAARVGRTRLTRMARMLFQPHFVGDVRTDRPYVLLDDTFTLGGTLAALRTHIRINGGTVLGVSALAHSAGRSLPFALTSRTQRSLYVTYSTEIDRFWKQAIGHEANCLTDAEGCHLVDWAGQNCRGQRDSLARLHALRTRLARARINGE